MQQHVKCDATTRGRPHDRREVLVDRLGPVEIRPELVLPLPPPIATRSSALCADQAGMLQVWVCRSETGNESSGHVTP